MTPAFGRSLRVSMHSWRTWWWSPRPGIGKCSAGYTGESLDRSSTSHMRPCRSSRRIGSEKLRMPDGDPGSGAHELLLALDAVESHSVPGPPSLPASTCLRSRRFTRPHPPHADLLVRKGRDLPRRASSRRAPRSLPQDRCLAEVRQPPDGLALRAELNLSPSPAA